MRFGDFDKAFRGVGVAGMEIGVVGFGEFIELFLDLGGCGIDGEIEGRVVVWCCMIISTVHGAVELASPWDCGED